MKKTIYWLLQSNQLTPTIIDFLETLKTRLFLQLDLQFIIPETSSDIFEKTKKLKPKIFKVLTRTATSSHQVYLAKKAALNGAAYTDGLKIEDTLLLDDFGGGNTRQTTLSIPFSENVRGLVLQIPTPLGSSESEERIYQSAIFWANQNRVPSIGYELLPIDTRWTLTASLPDAVITRTAESHSHLISELTHKNIWLLPNYEASIFSPVASNFHLNGVKASYHYRNHHQIPSDRTILFIPHNVAMIYEYKDLLKALIPCGKKLHLMMGIGKDQIRGAYSQKETIEIVYKEELDRFASFSFHDINTPWEMMAADALVACSSCFNTLVAQKDIPCIIYDTGLHHHEKVQHTKLNRPQELQKQIKTVINRHQTKSELADILIMLIKNTDI